MENLNLTLLCILPISPVKYLSTKEELGVTPI
jgi:hypothetical protein